MDIAALVRGAQEMERDGRRHAVRKEPGGSLRSRAQPAVQGGKKIEILGSYEPKFQYINEWWKQLYGEAKAKDGKGIFPASVTLTADLHSMGPVYSGRRTHAVRNDHFGRRTRRQGSRRSRRRNLDGLNFLAGKRISEINRMAELGVQLAHVDGGVPNIRIEIPQIDAHAVGSLLYFFERACGISGYILGVNPFDQPGVEAYKKNMFALLDKPGYEEASKAIKAQL